MALTSLKKVQEIYFTKSKPKFLKSSPVISPNVLSNRKPNLHDVDYVPEKAFIMRIGSGTTFADFLFK